MDLVVASLFLASFYYNMQHVPYSLNTGNTSKHKQRKTLPVSDQQTKMSTQAKYFYCGCLTPPFDFYCALKVDTQWRIHVLCTYLGVNTENVRQDAWWKAINRFVVLIDIKTLHVWVFTSCLWADNTCSCWTWHFVASLEREKYNIWQLSVCTLLGSFSREFYL